MNIDYLIKFHRDKLTECDRCGNLELHMEKLREPYERVELLNICSLCHHKTNSFVNYYGYPKKKRDIEALYRYLTSGSKQQEKLTAMMNAGYF